MDTSALFSPFWLVIIAVSTLAIGGLVWSVTESFIKALIASACAVVLLKIGGLPFLIGGIVLQIIIESLFLMIKKMRLKKKLRLEYGKRPASEAEMKDMLKKFWDDEMPHLTTEYKGQGTLVSKELIAKYLNKNNRRIATTLNYICGKNFKKLFCDETMPPVANLDTLEPGNPVYPKQGMLDCWLGLLAPNAISYRGRQYDALHEVFAHQAERQFRRRAESL